MNEINEILHLGRTYKNDRFFVVILMYNEGYDKSIIIILHKADFRNTRRLVRNRQTLFVRIVFFLLKNNLRLSGAGGVYSLFF